MNSVFLRWYGRKQQEGVRRLPSRIWDCTVRARQRSLDWSIHRRL